jgi:RimK family alpha-L-glutamate ligase
MESWSDRFQRPQAVVSQVSGHRFLCLGGGDGWHAQQLQRAAASLDCRLRLASYESMRAAVGGQAGCVLECDAGSLHDYDAILTRTMPTGSLEQITFRLASLHSIVEADPAQRRTAVVNPPRSLEIAIDKFATLAHVSALGYDVPETIVVQSRREAIEAFKRLGGDCVIKPIFGGEGRGVMRIQDAELAWYTFATLEKLSAVCYVQRFVSPGGCDTRLLVIGDSVIGIRRSNHRDFRTNVSSGGRSEAMEPDDAQVALATRICRSMGLKFASVDLLDCLDGGQQVVEVNAIPGWKGAQSVAPFNIAARIIQLLRDESAACTEVRS